MKADINFHVNGVDTKISAEPMMRLLDVLRESLGLTGAKEGCGEGECGACSVFIDGELVNSCLVTISQVQNCKVITIEAMAQDKVGSAVQKSFIERGGAQCGICTPGMIMAAVNILNKQKRPTLAEIQDGLAGNLCRCTGYTKIYDAVEAAAKELADR